MSISYENTSSASTSEIMPWCVRLVDGKMAWRTWPLSQATLVVGRGLGCHLRLDDPKISRVQCELAVENGTPWVRNRSERNPTLVNSSPCEKSSLRLGDLIEFAGYRLIVDLSPASSASSNTLEVTPTALTTQSFDQSAFLCDAFDPAIEESIPTYTSDLLALFSLLRNLGKCNSMDALVSDLRAHLNRYLNPDVCWIAWHARVDGDLAFYPPVSPREMENAPLGTLRQVIKSANGILVTSASSTPIVDLAAPLNHAGAAIGAICVQRDFARGGYTEAHLHYLMAVADGVAPLILACERHEQLRRDEEASLIRKPAELRFIGNSKAMNDLRANIRRVASGTNNVLIFGETGVGKELAARMLHDLSPRAHGPYVIVNCAAVPEDLFESEVFGHERGAFTGALTARKGLFEQAHGGTLFLDEVGELSPANQARLLRAAESKTFRRVGAEKEIHVDVRIVSATNRRLLDNQDLQFRPDFYYRLTSAVIWIPPLRERRDDIAEIARHYLQEYGGHTSARPTEFSEDVLNCLMDHDWAGNVRELRNVVERACYEADGPCVNRVDLPVRMKETSEIQPTSIKSLEEVEREYLVEILRLHDDIVANAAQSLGIPASTLYYKLRRHGIRTRK